VTFLMFTLTIVDSHIPSSRSSTDHTQLDILMDFAKSKGEEIMASFPSELPHRSHIDYLALSSLFKSALSRNPPKAQVDILKQHVKNCMTMCSKIKQNRLDIRSNDFLEIYHLLCDGQEKEVTWSRSNSANTGTASGMGMGMGMPRSRSGYSGGNGSGQGLFTAGSRADSAFDSLVVLSGIRELGRIWNEKVTVDEVPDLCLGDEGILRRVKISCAAEVLREMRVEHKMLFP
jgi:hypothetical protein